MARKKQKLPLGVGCIAFFLLLGSLATVTAGVFILLHDIGRDLASVPKEAWKGVEAIDGVRVALSVITGLVGLPTSIGLFAKRLWAYYLYTVMNGFSIGLAAMEVAKWHQWIFIPGLFFNGLILLYMFLPGVKKVFA